MSIRLDKYICEATGQSRSEARNAVRRGMVNVNGVVCRKADAQVDEAAAVELLGQPVARTGLVYIMLDKPEGVVSAGADASDKTVVDLVRADFPRRNLFPAGRLDKTSTGFVLLTDDGTFAHDILAPKRHVAKTYRVVLDAPVTPEMVRAFEQGVTLADGDEMQPAQLIPDADDPYTATVILTQGVYHQIKRMLGVLDVGVNALRRIAIGPIVLDSTLGAGGYRLLTPDEVAQLAAAAGVPVGTSTPARRNREGKPSKNG